MYTQHPHFSCLFQLKMKSVDALSNFIIKESLQSSTSAKRIVFKPTLLQKNPKNEISSRFDSSWSTSVSEIQNLIVQLAADAAKCGLVYSSKIARDDDLQDKLRMICTDVVRTDSWIPVKFAMGNNLTDTLRVGIIPRVVLLTTAVLIRYETGKFPPEPTFDIVISMYKEKVTEALNTLNDVEGQQRLEEEDIIAWHDTLFCKGHFVDIMCRKCLILIYLTHLFTITRNAYLVPSLVEEMKDLLDIQLEHTKEFLIRWKAQRIWCSSFRQSMRQLCFDLK